MSVRLLPPPEPSLEQNVCEAMRDMLSSLQQIVDAGELRGFAMVVITKSDGACPFYLSGRTIELAGAAAFLQAKILEEE